MDSLGGCLSAFPASAAPSCDDFLARMHKKPPYIIFVCCDPQNTAQRSLRAIYRVSGKNAGRAEVLFRKLTFKSCGWDSPPSGFIFKRMAFELNMGTETAINKRSRWSQIKYFTIAVTKYEIPP